MVRSIRFDRLKYVDRSRHKFGGKLALFMQFGTFFVTRAKQDKMNVCFNFTLLILIEVIETFDRQSGA